MKPAIPPSSSSSSSSSSFSSKTQINWKDFDIQQVREFINKHESEEEHRKALDDFVSFHRLNGKDVLMLTPEDTKVLPLGHRKALDRLFPREQTTVALASYGIPELEDIDPKELLHPNEVQIPERPSESPAFTSEEGWMEKTCAEAILNYNRSDDSFRVPPMAVVRCSRGGKTRTLNEICHALKEKLATDKPVIISISMNCWTSLDPWEKQDPVQALCRRIAFAATNKPCDEFNSFMKRVSKEQIINWIGKHPCILVIDELNQLQEQIDTVVGKFLKDFFLSRRKRYLIFSSHVASTLGLLSQWMESSSARTAIVRMLPLIPSLSVARKNLGFNDLTPWEAGYFGFIPALIFTSKVEHIEAAIKWRIGTACDSLKPFTDDNVMNLLSTVITGDVSAIPKELQQFMDTISTDIINWIPFHLIHILRAFTMQQHILSTELHSDISTISKLFFRFRTADAQSGKGWEALFALILWIRYNTGLFDECVMPQIDKGTKIRASFNCHVRSEKGLETCDNINKLVDAILTPPDLPHIVIYLPTHSKFESYDVIAVYYDVEGNRTIYGWQCKEGKDVPRKPPQDIVKYSYVIRGASSQTTYISNYSWIVVAQSEIDNFMGQSGSLWTPKAWKSWVESEEAEGKIMEKESEEAEGKKMEKKQSEDNGGSEEQNQKDSANCDETRKRKRKRKRNKSK